VFRRRIAKALVVAALTGAVAAVPGTPAWGHRHGCHGAHTCPSDHATYRWRQPSTGARLLCVKPTAPKRNSTFNRRVRYGGYTYYCKR
jgi:hypothetical protein